MFLQQLLAPFSARAAVVKARDELVAAVGDRGASGSAQRRRRADAAVASLAARAVEAGGRLDLDALGPAPFEVVYASGGFPLWRTTSELAERLGGVFGSGRRAREESSGGSGGGVVASQQFDPRSRRLVNRVAYGGPIAISAYGEYEPLDERLTLPAAVRADVKGGRLELGGGGGEDGGGGRSIGLPFIRGEGRFEVLYADREVRVFRSVGPGGTAAISVQMPRRGGKEAKSGAAGQRRRRGGAAAAG
jgi:hypothetical protein